MAIGYSVGLGLVPTHGSVTKPIHTIYTRVYTVMLDNRGARMKSQGLAGISFSGSPADVELLFFGKSGYHRLVSVGHFNSTMYNTYL